MQPLWYFIFSLLCTLPVPSFALSMECNQTQYSWPFETPKLCCDKCPPGQYLAKRSPTTCHRECTPCTEYQFTDTYNVAMTCDFCESCEKPNMEVKTNCSATHNTVCTCKAGYECKGHNCNECVVIPTTTKPTVPPSTTVARPGVVTTRLPLKPIGDKVWFLVIIALLCTGIAMVVLTKVKPFLLWVKFNHGYLLAEKPAQQPPCAVDEEVSKPVQEVCGKCDQPIEICIKD